MRLAPAALLDTVLVLVFILIGRGNHEESSALLGVARTAWPFLVGLAVGWAAVARRRPLRIVPEGLVIWLSTVVLGVLLRFVSGQGVAFSFMAVTLVVLGAFLLGWRALAPVVSRRRRRADSQP